MEKNRRKFQGVLNILSFNRHFYYAGLSVMLLIVTSTTIINWNSLLLSGIVIAFTYGLIMPLIVSAYVYDFSGYYNFDWLQNVKIPTSKTIQIVNINAGFDETSFILKSKLPNSNLKVFDFYDADNHTEAAITRARKVSLVYPNTKQIPTGSIPLENQSVDLVFLLSATHEIRSNTEKISFLKECKRICKPNAQVILVEHLRDLPNFMAFSVGFTHFFTRNTWIKVFNEAGFKSFDEIKFTPFMSIFKFN